MVDASTRQYFGELTGETLTPDDIWRLQALRQKNANRALKNFAMGPVNLITGLSDVGTGVRPAWDPETGHTSELVIRDAASAALATTLPAGLSRPTPGVLRAGAGKTKPRAYSVGSFDVVEAPTKAAKPRVAKPPGIGSNSGIKPPAPKPAKLTPAQKALGKLTAKEQEMLRDLPPDPGPSVTRIDPKKGPYEGKGITDLGERVSKAKTAIQKEIDAGNYTPFFNILERDYADASSYNLPAVSPTHGKIPVTAAKQAEHRAIVQDPAAAERLLAAEKIGSEMENAGKWYGMKQLQDAYIAEFGKKEGLKRYDEDFATPMAATTGGSTPQQNLINVGYVNRMKDKGLPAEETSTKMPTFVGGGKVGGTSNMQAANKYSVRGEPIDPMSNPKRYDFRARFLGKTKGYNVIDDQMMQGWKPGGPGSPKWYGLHTTEIDRLSALANRLPEEFQENVWAGLKSLKDKNYTKQRPMIEEYNQAIERTSRILGISPTETLKLILRRKIPIYSVAGLGVLAGEIAKRVQPTPEEGMRDGSVI